MADQPELIADHRPLMADQLEVIADRPELIADHRPLMADQLELIVEKGWVMDPRTPAERS
jgi:hypothetical protein